MRIHLAGGGVYQATEMGSDTPSVPWMAPQQSWREKWQLIRGWWRYYQKYYSKKTNFFMGLDKVFLGLCLFGRLLRRSPKL